MGRVRCEGPFALNLLLSLVCHSSDLLTSGHTLPREGEKHLKGSGKQLKSYPNQLLVAAERLLEADRQFTVLFFSLQLQVIIISRMLFQNTWVVLMR